MITVSAAGETVTVNPLVLVPVTFADFTQNNNTSGLALQPQVANLSYSMLPKTSTKGSVVAALAAGSTNQFSLLSAGGNDAVHTVAGIDLSLDLVGTDQGHLYNGLRVGYSTGAKLHDTTISGIPGSSSSPPGETFSLNLWHANGSTVDRVAIDGKGVAATLFGLNSVAGCALTNCRANGSTYGFGIACWQSKDVTLIDFDARNNRRALNFERCSGTLQLTRVDMRGQTTTGPHITVNSDQASAKVMIFDPKVDTWPLRVGVSSQPYLGKPQLQKVSDVRLIVGGVDRSGDPQFLACGDVW